MEIWVQIALAIFGATGFWTLVSKAIDKKSASTKMLLGLGHDKVYELCLTYIKRGSITSDEYENLIKYLYEPYKALGGNGTAERLVVEVKKLPIVDK